MFKRIFLLIIPLLTLCNLCFADFTVTDSLNLSNCQSHLNSLDSKITTLQSTVSSINTYTTATYTDVSNIRLQLNTVTSDLNTINSYLNSVSGDTSAMRSQLTTLYNKVNSIDTTLTTIESQLSSILLELQTGNQSIVDSTDNVDSSVQAGNDIAQGTQDFITSETITDSNMNVDTSDYTIDDSNDVDGFISDILNELYVFFNGISESSVYTIEIPLPYGLDSIVLHSDMISSHLRGTILYTLIQTMWSFVFGTYLLFYVRFIIKFFSSGEFETSGLAFFLAHLEDNDVIINSTMM